VKLRGLAAVVAVAAVSLAGCALGPLHPAHPDLLRAPALGLAGDSTPPIAAEWWHAYGDPALDALVERALRDNPTLADALARLRAAEAATGVAGSALRPRVRGEINEERTHFSARSYYPPPYGGGTYWDGEADVAVSWHLDFWGRQHDRLKAAEHDARARVIAVRGARLAIETAVVANYFELDRAYALRDLARESADARSALARIAEQRTRAGLETDIETRTASAAVDDARVAERDAATRVELAVHRLAALSGQGPGAYGMIGRPNLQPGAGPPLPATLPADLLLRRGDVGVALEHLRALGALEHAARAAAYPDINLRAFAGLTAFGLRELLSAPARTMGAGVAVGLPIYDGGRVRAELRGAGAAVEGAIADYNATVLVAVREAADQLATIDALTAEAAAARTRVESLDAASRLAAERRDAGLTTGAPALEGRLRALAGRGSLVALESADRLARVALVAALGGSAEDPPPPSTPIVTQGAP
jgi:NodT family efflux transporter outer membrane factor (OMF) lipoprotein